MSKRPAKSSSTLPSMPFNEFLVVVGYNRSIRDTPEKVKMGDPDRFVIFGRVTADMGMEPPDPPLTAAEMQPVAYAAKMALYEVMMARRKKAEKGKTR